MKQWNFNEHIAISSQNFHLANHQWHNSRTHPTPNGSLLKHKYHLNPLMHTPHAPFLERSRRPGRKAKYLCFFRMGKLPGWKKSNRARYKNKENFRINNGMKEKKCQHELRNKFTSHLHCDARRDTSEIIWMGGCDNSRLHPVKLSKRKTFRFQPLGASLGRQSMIYLSTEYVDIFVCHPFAIKTVRLGWSCNLGQERCKLSSDNVHLNKSLRRHLLRIYCESEN